MSSPSPIEIREFVLGREMTIQLKDIINSHSSRYGLSGFILAGFGM
jgi:hypothetical protein